MLDYNKYQFLVVELLTVMSGFCWVISYSARSQDILFVGKCVVDQGNLSGLCMPQPIGKCHEMEKAPS